MTRRKWPAAVGALLVAGVSATGIAIAETNGSPNGRTAMSGSASTPTASSAATSSSSADAAQPSATADGSASGSPAALAARGVTTSTSPGATTAPATTAISLSSWAGLLLPISNEGTDTGKDAKVLSPARLMSPYLVQTAAGLQFWAPSGWATTPGSLHSRTELESAIKYAVGTRQHVLTATLQILQLPASNPEISVAQLHAGGSGGSNPFVMIDFKSGKLYVMVASGTSAKASFYTLLTGVPLGSSLSYRLSDNGDGTLTIGAASGSQHASYTVAIPGVLRGASGHFSAGDYQQGTVSDGPNDGGKVLFTALAQS